MSGAGVVLIAVVVLLSGALAYWGDLLGRHLGKKRLTFMGLRPRHTAAVMTALAGIFASLLAIGVLVLFAEPVRVMLVEGEKVRTQLADLQGRLDDASNQLNESRTELGSTKSDLAQEKVRLGTERQRVVEARGQVRTAQGQLQELRRTAAGLRNDVAMVRQSLVAVRSSLSTLKGQYRKLQETYKQVDGQRSYAEDQNLVFQKRNLELEQQGLELERRLDSQKAQLEEAKGQAERLATEVKRLEQDRDLSKNEIDGLKKESIKALNDLRAVQNELADARTALDQFRGMTESSRFMPLIFSRGDELSRLAVGDRLNASEARTYLLALLEAASSQAAGRGAKPRPGATIAAGLVDLRDRDGKPVSTATQISNLNQELAGKPRQQVLIARVFANAFRDEFVPVVVSILENPVVYASGAVVAETRIEGSDDQNLILSQLSKFLQDELSPKAVRDGMIPAIGKPDPLGEVDQAALLGLVTELSSVRRRVRVQFLAARETRAADRLRLDFRLR